MYIYTIGVTSVMYIYIYTYTQHLDMCIFVVSYGCVAPFRDDHLESSIRRPTTSSWISRTPLSPSNP